MFMEITSMEMSNVKDGKSTDNGAYRPDKTRNMSDNKMTCNNAQWGKLLYDYSQETSFHGPKQIVEKQPFLIRRFIWILLFLGGTVIFLLQVATSIEYYLSWPVSVDVKINYNDSIRFPAVTICNGNAFRITKAYKYGYYKLLNDVYGGNMEGLDMHKYNISDLSLEELYQKVGHSKEDLIVKCEWDESPCSADDFITSMTDYGMCYTFNGDKKDIPQKLATQTGAEGGLRLQLNIEQYQYMRGPNEGAGLKILIHRQNEIPLVRDYGLAVPPGSHGLVAVKTIEVNNLKPNHGKCNDSVKLEYFDEYSVSNCYTNCKEKYLEEHCHCRDIYMPSDKHGYPKACTIQHFVSCMVTASENFHKEKESCGCPIPCHRRLYEPIISYASTSNFDTDALLYTNMTNHLRQDYGYAMETIQRLNDGIIKRDIDLITTLNLTVNKLDQAFKNMNQGIEVAQSFLENSLNQLQKRIRFHKDRGIEAVRFTIKHDFNRGWEVFDERSFHYVTLDFMDLPRSVNRTIQNAKNNFNLSTKLERYQIYSSVMDKLLGRQELVERTADFINETHFAYLTGVPLLTYKLTYGRRYDMSYISLPLLQSGSKQQDEQHTALVESLELMRLGLSALLHVGEQFLGDNVFNESLSDYGGRMYISGCKKFNFRYFMFGSRVVEKPLEVIEHRISEFAMNNRTLTERQNNVVWKIQQITDLINGAIRPVWQNMSKISEMASLYLSDIKKFKTPLSLKVTSETLEESIRTLSVCFSDVRSRARELQDEISSLKLSYKDIWKSMLLEESTKSFYEMIYNDSQEFLKNETSYEMYINVFRYMLRTTSHKLRKITPEEIVERINGDFFAMNIDDVFELLDTQFSNLSSILDLAKDMGESDELFLVSFEKFRQSMQSFLDDNAIDSRFYRENFMRLDVFIQELSYEEITQQKSYEIAQLLSDIGGSMGLFIGGSVLSIFEFLDIFVHHGARIAFNR